MSLLIDHPRLFTIIRQFVDADISIDAAARIDVLPACRKYALDFAQWIMHDVTKTHLALMADKGIIPSGEVAHLLPDAILCHHQVAFMFFIATIPGFDPWFKGVCQGIFVATPEARVEGVEARLAAINGDAFASRMMGTSPTRG